MRLSTPPRALVVSGWDPTGGAGLAADLAVLLGHGVAPSGAVSALTSQGPKGLHALTATAPDLLAAQIRDALDVALPHVVKLGLLPDAATVDAVGDALAEFEGPIVLDPVLGVSAGGWALGDVAQARLVERLLPRAAVITPNGPEALGLARVLGLATDDVVEAACRLSSRGGARAVVLTGGHGEGPDVEDVLAVAGLVIRRWSSTRIDGGPFHGTGCAFASGLAARMARGEPLTGAVEGSRNHVRALLRMAASRGAWRLPFALLRAGVEVVDAPPVS